MGFYNKIFSNSIKVGGSSKGAKPAFLMPPDGSFVKIGFQIYEALDLICEGPIAGLTDQRGLFLNKSKEIESLMPVDTSTPTHSSLTIDFNSFVAENTGGSTARVWFPLQSLIKVGTEVEIEFNASNLTGGTYSVELTTEKQNDTQASTSKVNVTSGRNIIVLTASQAAQAVMFEVTSNATLTINEFNIRFAAQNLRAKKDFNSDRNVLGSSTQGIDKGIYFDDKPLRNQNNDPNLGKYDVSLRLGEEFQEAPVFGGSPQKMTVLSTPIKGPYDLGGIRVRDSQLSSVKLELVQESDADEGFEETTTSTRSLFLQSLLEAARSRGRSAQNKKSAQLPGRSHTDLRSQARKAEKKEGTAVVSQELKLTVISSDPDVINLVNKDKFKNQKETLKLRIFGLTGTESSKINFVQDEPDEKITRKQFVLSSITNNTNGTTTLVAFATHTFVESSPVAAFGPLTSVDDTSGDFAGFLTLASGDVSSGSARRGTGSRDVRTEGTSARDFVKWQNFFPIDRDPRPYRYVNYDSNITKLLITLQIDALQDTKSFATAAETESGRTRIGTPLPLTITFKVRVGKVDKDGVKTEENAVFTTRAGNSVTVGDGNGIIAVTGIITNPYTISLEGIKLPTLTETDLFSFVDVSKIEYETVSNLIKRDGNIKSITEFTDETFLYPNSCTVATSIDARFYPQVPERTFRLKGKKVLIPSNYTPIDASGVDRRFAADKSTRGNVIYDGPWDGTFKFGWTDNPAWIYYDLLISTRYGIGSYLRDTNIIDKWSLFEIGQYCDAVTLNDGSRTSKISGVGTFIGLDDGLGGLEPRFSCNIMFKDQTNAVDALQNLARTFRALSFYNNSTMSVRADRPYFATDFNRTEEYEAEISENFQVSKEFIPPKQLKFPPHLIFNNENVLDGFFSYSDVDKTQRLSALEVSFLDKRTNYTPKTEYVEDAELIKQFGLNVQQIEGVGITSRSQANRFAKFALFESANSNETVTFKVGFEGLLLTPGDIIQVDDELKNFSKNYGTVLTVSGEQTYFNPDATGEGIINTNDGAVIESGIGPKAILVQPAIGTSQLDGLVKGNIHLYNAIGKSGSNEFYVRPTSPNSGYRDIHQTQVISLKLKEGGAGITYNEVDDGVLFNLDAQSVFKGVGESSDATAASQWFSRNKTNLLAGSKYSIDISGVNSKYYRVLNVNEDEDNGFGVSAVIHHTGKFRFVEENLSFDLDSDIAQPDLKLSSVTKPNKPTGITSGAFSQNTDLSLNLPIQIHKATSSPGDRYVVLLEEPNKNLITSFVDRSTDGTTTNFTLQNDAKIDQIGTYQLTVFSEIVTPIIARSDNAETVSFTTNAEDFSLNTSTDSFIEYQNISMLTDFNSSYNENDDIGTGQNSFFENDPKINATIKVNFRDIFGDSGNSILQKVNEQRIDILNATGATVKRNFRKLNNETEFVITNTGLEDAFDFTNVTTFAVPPNLKFQSDFFTLSGKDESTLKDTTGTFIRFGHDVYDNPPMVFIQQVVSGSSTDENGLVTRERPLGRMSISTSGFQISNSNPHPTKYVYFASPTGVFKLDGGEKLIQVGSGNMEADVASFQTVQFQDDFGASVPKVVVQLQSTGKDHDKDGMYAITSTSGVAGNQFSFGAFNESGKPLESTGIFGYIATDIESFNTLAGGALSLNSINISTDRISLGSTEQAAYIMTGENATQILTNLSDSSRRFASNQQILFVQNTGAINTGVHYVVNRLGAGNSVTSHSMVTGRPGVSGFRTLGNTTGNRLILEFQNAIGAVGDVIVQPQFKITASDISSLEGPENNAIGRTVTTFTPYPVFSTSTEFFPDVRIKSLTFDTNADGDEMRGVNLNPASPPTVTISNPNYSATTASTDPFPSNVAQNNTTGAVGIGQTDGGAATFTLVVDTETKQITTDSLNATNSGINRFRQDGSSVGTWTVTVTPGVPSSAGSVVALTGNVHVATMVNVPPTTTNQMFILDNVLSGIKDDDGAQLLPNVNKSGFAFFLSGADMNPYLYVDGDDFKLSDTKINDGENHFIEAHINREPILSSTERADEIVGYVDGVSGVSAHSINQNDIIDYFLSGTMCLFNNSGTHGQSQPFSLAFNNGNIIDAIGVFTGRNRFSDDVPVEGSLYKAEYKTGLQQFIALHETGSRTFMLTTFTDATFENGLKTAAGVSNRGFSVQKHGSFEKSDIIIDRSGVFNFDFIQIGATGI